MEFSRVYQINLSISLYPDVQWGHEKLGEWIIIVIICDDPNPSKISDENSVVEEKEMEMISKLSKKINSFRDTSEAHHFYSIEYF